MQVAEGDPKKLAWFRDARWTTNHPLDVLTEDEVKVFPGTCLKCVWGIGEEHTADCVVVAQLREIVSYDI